MKMLRLVQVLLLASSLISQMEAYFDEQQTTMEYSDGPLNQTFDLRYATDDYVPTSVGKGTNNNTDTTKDEEAARKLAKRKLRKKMELSEIHTELLLFNISLEALKKSSGFAGHVGVLSNAASQLRTAAAAKTLPAAGGNNGLRRFPRDIRSDVSQTSDYQSNNTNQTDSGSDASRSSCCQTADEDQAATLPVAEAALNELDGGNNRYVVENDSEVSSAALTAESKVASTAPSASWQSILGFSGNATASASSVHSASATNALTAVVTDSPWNQSRGTALLPDATTSSTNLHEASALAGNLTGYAIKAGNGSNPSAAQEAHLTTTATTSTADVTSHVTDSPATGDNKVADNQQLAIIIAASAGGTAVAALIFPVVCLLCRYHRWRLASKKLQLAQQQPRLSVLWPQALHRDSSLVPRDAYTCNPSAQPIELVEGHLHTEATVGPMLKSFNDVPSS